MQNITGSRIIDLDEIRRGNLEKIKTFQWQKIQSSIYLNNIEKLKINQKYESYRFLAFFQMILVVFISSLEVMNNNMTIGTLLAVMFIIAGINTPISKLINFILKKLFTEIILPYHYCKG